MGESGGGEPLDVRLPVESLLYPALLVEEEIVCGPVPREGGREEPSSLDISEGTFTRVPEQTGEESEEVAAVGGDDCPRTVLPQREPDPRLTLPRRLPPAIDRRSSIPRV